MHPKGQVKDEREKGKVTAKTENDFSSTITE
jgi:hypothetical protein